MSNEGGTSQRTIVLSPIFKLIFLTVLGLTLISLVVALYLASKGSITEYQADLFTTCSTTWKMGFGAIVGLIGGKVV